MFRAYWEDHRRLTEWEQAFKDLYVLYRKCDTADKSSVWNPSDPGHLNSARTFLRAGDIPGVREAFGTGANRRVVREYC